MQERITVLPDDSYEGKEPIIVKNNGMFFALIKGETIVSFPHERFYNFLDSLLSIVSFTADKPCEECEQVNTD